MTYSDDTHPKKTFFLLHSVYCCFFLVYNWYWWVYAVNNIGKYSLVRDFFVNVSFFFFKVLIGTGGCSPSII